MKVARNMRLSGQPITQDVEEEIRQLLIQVIADIRTEEDADQIVNDLFTGPEQLTISKRLAISLLLTRGQSYAEIREKLRVSSATVAKVQESLDAPGIKLALKIAEANSWAGEWAGKLTGAFDKLLGK